MTAASVETRVRVLRFEKTNGTVLPRIELAISWGTLPSLKYFLCKIARSTKVDSSLGVKSAIESKWRGLVTPPTKGEGNGTEGVEIERTAPTAELGRAAALGKDLRTECIFGIKDTE